MTECSLFSNDRPTVLKSLPPTSGSEAPHKHRQHHKLPEEYLQSTSRRIQRKLNSRNIPKRTVQILTLYCKGKLVNGINCTTSVNIPWYTQMVVGRVAQSVQRLPTDWTVRGSNPGEARFSAPVQTSPEAHPASYTMGTGSFLGVRCCRGVTLTPHPLIMQRSKIEQSYTSTLPKGLRDL